MPRLGATPISPPVQPLDDSEEHSYYSCESGDELDSSPPAAEPEPEPQHDPSTLTLTETQYVHVIETKTNATYVVCGPTTIATEEDESSTEPFRALLTDLLDMVVVPEGSYCMVYNPVDRDFQGDAKRDPLNSRYLIRFGETEVRLSCPPFPLYPGEMLLTPPTPLPVVAEGCALRLRAVTKHYDMDAGEQREKGDEWLAAYGPTTYTPSVDAEIVETVEGVQICESNAALVRARVDLVDNDGSERSAGAEWLVSEIGTYIPPIGAEVVELIDGIEVTCLTGVALEANYPLTDCGDNPRKAGERWIVTHPCSLAISSADTDPNVNNSAPVHAPTHAHSVCASDRVWYVPRPGERVIDHSLHAVDLGMCAFYMSGTEASALRGKTLFPVEGPAVVFNHPSHNIFGEIERAGVADAGEAVLVEALRPHDDLLFEGVVRREGERWLVHGPTTFVPSGDVQIVEIRKTWDVRGEGEGVYVCERHNPLNTARLVSGCEYMLTADEVLFEKLLPDDVETMLVRRPWEKFDQLGSYNELQMGGATEEEKQEVATGRVLHLAVCVRVPEGMAACVNDTRKVSGERVVFGPNTLVLGAYEQFVSVMMRVTPMPNAPAFCMNVASLCIPTVPHVVYDGVEVTTVDHAIVTLTLAYLLAFDAEEAREAGEAHLLFASPFYATDILKTLARTIRVAVSNVTLQTLASDGKQVLIGGIKGAGIVLPPYAHLNNLDIVSISGMDEVTATAVAGLQSAAEEKKKSIAVAEAIEAERKRLEQENAQRIQAVRDEIERLTEEKAKREEEIIKKRLEELEKNIA